MATGWVSAAPLQKEMGRNTQVVPVLSVRTGILRPQGWVSRLHGSSSVPAGGVLVLAGLEFGLCRDLHLFASSAHLGGKERLPWSVVFKLITL